MSSSKCDFTMWPRRISALSVVTLTVLTIFFLGWNDVRRVSASSTQQRTRPVLLPELPDSILGLLTAISGGGGAGLDPIGPEACDRVETLSGESFWLFPKEKIESDGFISLQLNNYIVAIRCGPPHSESIQYTLTGEDGVVLQEAAELPFVRNPDSTIANDYFAYGMDWGHIERDITLTIEGDIKPISHTFHVAPTQRIYVRDWQTGIRKNEYNAGERLYIELAGFESKKVVNIVLYQQDIEGDIIPIQTSQVTINENGIYASSYSLPDDLQSGSYIFIACSISECSIDLSIFGLYAPPIAINIFSVTDNSVFVDPVTGFTGLRLRDLDNDVRLERVEPGEELLRDSGRRFVNNRTYAPVKTIRGTEGWVLNRYLIEQPMEKIYFDLTWCDPALPEVRLRQPGEDSCVNDSIHPILSLQEWEAKLKIVVDGDTEIDLLEDDESLALSSVSGSTLRFAVQNEQGVHNGWINIGTDVPHNHSPSPVSGVWRTDQDNRYVEPICWYRTDDTWRCETAIGLTPWIR